MDKKIELIELKSNTRYWLVRADGGKYYEHFKHHSFISVHHNEITLEKLQSSTLLLTKEKNIEYYKMQILAEHKDDNWTKHKIAFAANRLYSFIEEMTIGDYVIVPSYKSNHFLIGQITGEVKEVHLPEESSLNYEFDTTTDSKRRKIKWINEVPRRKINPKFLYSTLTMHQSIIEVTQYSKYIDGLISPLYLKEGKLNLKLNVNTEKPITSQMWKSLYSVIDLIRNEKLDEEITVTTNVESPGDINLTTIVKFVSDHKDFLNYGILSLAVLFGDVDIKIAKIKGVVPTLISIGERLEEKRKLKIENDSAMIDLETKEKDVELHDIERRIQIKEAENKLLELSLNDSHQIRELDITIDSPNVSYANEDQTQTDSE